MTLAQQYENVLLALCVWREAQGEPYEGQRAVAWTIRNRMMDPRKRWHPTASGVILQPLQFSCFNAKDPQAAKTPRTSDRSWESCCKAVEDTAPDPTRGANHYTVTGLVKPWTDPKKVSAVIGRHTFYKL